MDAEELATVVKNRLELAEHVNIPLQGMTV